MFDLTDVPYSTTGLQRLQTAMPFYPRPIFVYDMGDRYATFFTAFMRRNCRLVYRDPAREVYGPRPETGSPLWDWLAQKLWRQQHLTALTDAAPLHILTSASLGALSEISGGQAIAPERFRPNIMVTGCEAWDEETWKLVHVKDVGNIAITARCPRCGVPDIDLGTGERDRQIRPSVVLKKFHTTDPSPTWGNRPMFGMWATHLVKGKWKILLAVKPQRRAFAQMHRGS